MSFFIDHYSKYVWLYPMKQNSDVSTIFPVFKSLVEKQLQSTIKTLYSDNGGEYIKLHSFLQRNVITHLITPPYTPEYNGLSECKHRHLVETARGLLHHSQIPSLF